MTHRVYLPHISNQQPGLKDLFGKHGIQFGFAVSSGSFKNQTTKQLIVQHANIVTTEVALKMEYTQPQRGVWDFSEGDAIVAAAHELGIDVHGHTLSWHMQNPDWLVKGGFTRDQLADILREHVRAVSYHYRYKTISFDTANEAYIKPDGGVFAGPWQPLGEDYVTISFQCALAKKPPMYNSFWPHPDMEHPKALDLLDKEWADGIGIQLHLWDGSYQKTLAHTETFLKQIRARGSWCRFSEISVRAVNEQSRAVVYRAITKLAIKYEDIVKGVIVWGVTDKGAWRENSTLFDNAGKPKPACAAVCEELRK